MDKETAFREAQAEANKFGKTLIVTHNRFGDKAEEENFGYLPQGALKIFKYETLIATITPEKE